MVGVNPHPRKFPFLRLRTNSKRCISVIRHCLIKQKPPINNLDDGVGFEPTNSAFAMQGIKPLSHPSLTFGSHLGTRTQNLCTLNAAPLPIGLDDHLIFIKPPSKNLVRVEGLEPPLNFSKLILSQPRATNFAIPA